MAGDGVSTRLQKEVGGMQQEISKIHEEITRVETKLEQRLQDFKTEFQGDLQVLLSQYFGPPPVGSSANVSGDKGKGVLGAPPGFGPKNRDFPPMQAETVIPNGGSEQVKDSSHIAGVSINHSRLECPKFDGTDFRGWWTKLEQYFEAEEIHDASKVRVVILNLEGRALEWHHFYSQRNGGLQRLAWPAYIRSLQDRFGCGTFGDPMRELVNLKQQGTVEQFQDLFVGLLNQLHLPESYALSIFLGNLKSEIGHYLDLFTPSTLMEAFQLAKKIEILMSHSGKGSTTTMGVQSSRTFSNTSALSRPSSFPTRPVVGNQGATKVSTNNQGSRNISPAVMAERKQKGLCFWCGVKYHAGHKCMRSQLYQVLLEPHSDGEIEEFQECSDKLEENGVDEEGLTSPTISLNALTGMQGHNTMRMAAKLGTHWAIILVDSGSTHNFVDAKLVHRLSLPVMRQEQLRVSVANGSCLFTRGLCKEITWEVHNQRFTTDFMVLALKGCDMVLGVQWLLTLGDIMWNFGSLTMQFKVAGESYVLQGIAPGSLAADNMEFKPRCFAAVGQSMGPFSAVLSSPKQMVLTTKENENHELHLQGLLREFDDIFQVPKGLPPRRVHDHKIPLMNEGVVVKMRPYRYPAFQKNEMEKLIKEMLQAGIIRDSTSSFASPIVMVKKKDGSWRLCVDYRQLNQHTVKDKFPFPVIRKVGAVAYTLQLPPQSRIHPTFHVSQLKKHVGTVPTQAQLPLMDEHGVLPKEPVRIIDRRIVKRGTQAITEVLVEWANSFPEDATLESFTTFQSKFPNF
ncbi:uncharacterized protein LOC105775598 [Gossypium raimondii]|uniref:uncharacterized protein LOC105775598 n=1 Tax=Gossypium raimondii TaxID=29730 RepID=UPI00063AF15E|nr:uncharacterized protein LOC105775598 [Gossypium raimondii]